MDKKQSNLSQLVNYAGGHRYLTYLSLVLSDGSVAEMGAPEVLMKQKGMFTQMVKLQSESQNWMLA
jgi:hypothetical protein